MGNDFRIGTTKPLAGYRESTITTDFGDSGFLQKGQRHTASANEDEVSSDNGYVAGVAVFYDDFPFVTVAAEVFYDMPVADFGPVGLGCGKELFSKGAVVDVSASIGPGDCYFVGFRTAFRHEW